METKKFFKRNNGSAIIEVVGKHESGDYLCVWLFGDVEPFRYNKYNFDKEFVPIRVEEVNKLERHRCGRRGESFIGDTTIENPDYWRVLQNGDKVCSYCGSMHPNCVIDAIRKYGFGIIDRSTKSYKWYINQPNISNAGQGGIKYYRQNDTEDFIKQFNSLIDLKNKK